MGGRAPAIVSATRPKIISKLSFDGASGTVIGFKGVAPRTWIVMSTVLSPGFAAVNVSTRCTFAASGPTV